MRRHGVDSLHGRQLRSERDVRSRGHVATVENWAALSTEWGELLPFATLNKHHRREFKMVEMMKTPERIENIQPFFRLIKKYVDTSISVRINTNDHLRAMRRIYVPRCNVDFGELRHPFILAFRFFIDSFHGRCNEITHIPKDSLIDFVFDAQSEAKMVMAAWSDYVANRPERIRDLYGQTPVFRDSEKYVPLQAADLWAGWVRLCESSGNVDNIGACDFGSWRGKRERKAAHLQVSEDDILGIFRRLVRETIEPGRPIWDVTYSFG